MGTTSLYLCMARKMLTNSIFLAESDTKSLSLPLRSSTSALRPLSRFQVGSSLCGGSAYHPLRSGLLPLEHALHVDHMGRPLLWERKLLLLPDHRLSALPLDPLHSVVRGCRQETEEVTIMNSCC